MSYYSIKVIDGRRIQSYRIEASSPEEAKQRYMHYLSLLGAVVCEEIIAEEETDGTQEAGAA